MKRWMSAAHRIGAEEHGLLFAARMQQPVGENMAAFGIGAKLDFVDRQERRAEIDAASLPRCRRNIRAPGGTIFSSPVIRAARSAPLQPHDLVIDLARQQPQRQADHAGFVGQHPLDGEMGLAGVGGPKNGRNAAPKSVALLC